MPSLSEVLASGYAFGNSDLGQAVSEFSPAEIRQTIAAMVTKGELGLANALSDAGLSLYPESEDILAISALLAETQSDWPQAEQLLEQLIAIQGDISTPTTWRHMIRVQRCHCEPGKALQSARQALLAHPHDPDLLQELQALHTLAEHQTLLTTPLQVQ